MDMFSALSDPTRRQIIELLSEHKKLPATDIAKNFKVSQPAISQHLKVLRKAKLVHMERFAQKHIYQINVDSFIDLEQWILKLAKVWDDRFDRLDVVLQENKKRIERR